MEVVYALSTDRLGIESDLAQTLCAAKELLELPIKQAQVAPGFLDKRLKNIALLRRKEVRRTACLAEAAEGGVDIIQGQIGFFEDVA